MDAALIIAMAAFCTVLPWTLGQRYGVIPLISPMHLLAYFGAMGFLVKAVVYPVAPDWAFYARYIDTSGAQVLGAIYLTSFIILMCLGYFAAVGSQRVRAATPQIRLVAGGLQRRGELFLFAIAIAAITTALILQSRGMAGFSTDALQTLNANKQIDVSANGVGATLAGLKTFFIVPKCAFVLLLAQAVIARDLLIFGMAGLIAGLLVMVAMLSGDRFELVELLAYGTATYLIVGGIIRTLSLCVAGGCGIGVLLLSAYMTALRGSDAGLLHQIVGSTYFLDYNAAVMVTDRVLTDMYLLGDSYTWWRFGWVPRAVWPEKPAVDLGVFFKRDVMGLATGGAFNVTGPGEAFINFGWAGMGVGAVLGWVYRKLEVWLLSAKVALRHAGFVVYPLLFYPFVQATLQSSFSAFLVSAALQAVLIMAMIAVFVPRFGWRPPARIMQRRMAHVG